MKKRAFVKYDEAGNIIPDSLVFTNRKTIPNKLYYEVTKPICCIPPVNLEKWYEITECSNTANIISSINYPIGTFALNDRVSDTNIGATWTITNIFSTDPLGTQYAIFSLSATGCPPTPDQSCVITPGWSTTNLDVTTYRNGDPIPEVTDETAWASLTTGAWCYYDNDPANGAVYGKLYNWYAVNDPRGLVPVGYHIPTDAEWTTLTNCLGGESIAGGKMKSTTGWTAPNTGATNSSGFTGLPGGNRDFNGPFFNIGDFGFWWSSTEYNTTIASVRYLFYNYAYASSNYANKTNGFSVRIIQD